VAARTAAVISIVILAVLFGAPLLTASTETPGVAPEALDRSIDEVMQQREFTWRMPRQATAQDRTEPKGPIASVAAWIVEQLKKGLDAVVKWIDQLIEWLLDLLTKDDRRRASPDTSWITSVRIAVIALLIGLLGALVYILWRSWTRRQIAQAEVVAATAGSTLDLEDEDTTAADLPLNGWLELARDFIQKGSLRLAIRAFYLATLAGLAEHGLITIENFKSNREYEMELHRRAHQKKDLIADFAKCRQIFECVWYGMHAIERPDLEHFATLQKRMMTLAQN
jgi:hypothetical protein